MCEIWYVCNVDSNDEDIVRNRYWVEKHKQNLENNVSDQHCIAVTYNPGHSIAQLYNVLAQLQLAISKAKFGI